MAGSAAAQMTALATAGIDTPPQASAAPLTLTFQDALTRARQNEPQFLAARAEVGIAHEDKVQARAGLLPSVGYETGYLYTQGLGNGEPRYIANNAVHEYIAQGNAHQQLSAGAGQVYELRRAGAAEALARAKLELATRGLLVTVAQNYYGLVVAQRKYATAQAGVAEAQRFLTISQNLERGGEVAHSDVVKAQLQFNDRRRDLQEAQLAQDKARLALSVLLFRDFNQNFTVVDDLALTGPPPSIEEVRLAVERRSPDLNAATAALRAARAEVGVARAGHFPSLTFDYWYGIDATHFATRNPGGVRNLGYAAAATLNLPVWNWGAVQSKVKQAELRRQQAQVELSATQRQLLANVESFYREAEAARAERDLLRQSFDLASEGLRLTTLRYQGGEATVLEVVDAQNTLIQARNAFDDGEARYKIALANLQALTGAF